MLIEFCSLVVSLKILLGEFLDEERDGQWGDTDSREALGDRFVELENALDELPGEQRVCYACDASPRGTMRTSLAVDPSI